MNRSLLLLLPLALVLAACDSHAPPSAEAEGLSARPVPGAAPFALTGFAVPESAQYDPVDDVYYVSNISSLFEQDGFISRIPPSASGDVTGEPGYQWITGLNSPTGIALQGDLLHVVDRDGLYTFAIDRAASTASPAGFVALGGEGSFLNDVCVGNDGAVYVTDTGLDPLAFAGTGTDAIYRIVGGEASVLLAGTHLQGPNGCYVDGANIFWTTFFSNRLYRTNPSGRVFTVATLPEGGIDSAVRVGGFFYLSSWDGSAVYRTSLGGSQSIQVASIETPGDMGYDARRHRLLVPSVFSADGRVVVVPLR
jgi:hypothetical protein